MAGETLAYVRRRVASLREAGYPTEFAIVHQLRDIEGLDDAKVRQAMSDTRAKSTRENPGVFGPWLLSTKGFDVSYTRHYLTPDGQAVFYRVSLFRGSRGGTMYAVARKGSGFGAAQGLLMESRSRDAAFRAAAADANKRGLVPEPSKENPITHRTALKYAKALATHERASLRNPPPGRAGTFGALPVGAVFEFERAPFSGMAEGPWRKVSTRVYVAAAPGHRLTGHRITIGSTKAKVVMLGMNPRRRGSAVTHRARAFIGRTIRTLAHEGMGAPRRIAAAYSMARRRGFKVPLKNPMSRKDFELMAAMIADRQLSGMARESIGALVEFAIELGKATNPRFDADRFATRVAQLVGEKRPYRYVNRNPRALSESKVLTEALAAVKRAARRTTMQAAMPDLREIVIALSALRDQAARGVHENPALAIVGANPPGKLLGYVTGQLRYRRTIGRHPGWYQHHFKTRARLLAMPDGSLRIAS